MGKRKIGPAHLAEAAIDRAVLRFVNGLSLVMDGGATAVGSTPRERILTEGKLCVYRYPPPERDEIANMGEEVLPIGERRFPVPILMVPPLMVQPYIYDLRPAHSMVRYLRRAGFDVYVVDFGTPGREDEGLRLDDYVLNFLPTALRAVRTDRGGAPDVTLAGYCMGGIFALLYAAAWRDPNVRNLVTIASPIDFDKMGLLTFLARAAHGQVQAIVDRIGNVPARLEIEGFKLLAPLKRVTRYADLFVNLWNDEYVKGFDAINRFTNDLLPYPKEAFKQFMSEFMTGNRLMEGIVFGHRRADLRALKQPLLAFAGDSDEVATPASARAILAATSSRDVEFVLAPGGHIGVVAGAQAKGTVWNKIAEWLRPRSLAPQ